MIQSPQQITVRVPGCGCLVVILAIIGALHLLGIIN